ncbi:hypothetical protein BGZ54_004046, partial [Gamsiella multidivaricata]
EQSGGRQEANETGSFDFNFDSSSDSSGDGTDSGDGAHRGNKRRKYDAKIHIPKGRCMGVTVMVKFGVE